jgi:hypothetical protein
MKWAEFKKNVESQGVGDDDEMLWIDWTNGNSVQVFRVELGTSLQHNYGTELKKWVVR